MKAGRTEPELEDPGRAGLGGLWLLTPLLLSPPLWPRSGPAAVKRPRPGVALRRPFVAWTSA